jgi:hypothetical protein
LHHQFAQYSAAFYAARNCAFTTHSLLARFTIRGLQGLAPERRVFLVFRTPIGQLSLLCCG